MNADIWLGAIYGVLGTIAVFALGALLDKTKATREAATSRSGRPIRSTPLYANHRKMSREDKHHV